MSSENGPAHPRSGPAHAPYGVVAGSRSPTGMPSTLARIDVAPKPKPRKSFRTSAGVSRPSPGVCTSKALSSGKNSAVCRGTAHSSRVALPEPLTPTRKKTSPDCPVVQFAPVPSTSGFAAAGCARTYFHQATDRSSYEPPDRRDDPRARRGHGCGGRRATRAERDHHGHHGRPAHGAGARQRTPGEQSAAARSMERDDMSVSFSSGGRVSGDGARRGRPYPDATSAGDRRSGAGPVGASLLFSPSRVRVPRAGDVSSEGHPGLRTSIRTSPCQCMPDL